MNKAMITEIQARAMHALAAEAGMIPLHILTELQAIGYLSEVADMFVVTDTGRAALAEYDAAHASSRDDLARAMHDASTQDSADELRNLLLTIPTKDELQQSVEAMRQINDAWAKDKARIAELEALLREAVEGLNVFEDAVDYDDDLDPVFEDNPILLKTPDEIVRVCINEDYSGFLQVKHLRTAATIAAKLRKALGGGG